MTKEFFIPRRIWILAIIIVIGFCIFYMQPVKRSVCEKGFEMWTRAIYKGGKLIAVECWSNDWKLKTIKYE